MRNWRSIGLSLVLLAVAGLAPLSAARAADDETAVQKATTDFYSALNSLFEGETSPMNAVWSHENDVTYMGPGGGYQVGWQQVQANWEAQAAEMLGGTVQPENIHITTGPEIAVVTCYEMGENMVDGKPQKVSIRATNTFRNENGQWKMIGHHTDLLPFLAQ